MRIVLLMKVPEIMNPIAPLGVINRQCMKRPRQESNFLIVVYSSQRHETPQDEKAIFILCAPHKMFFATNKSDSCMHRRHRTYLKMYSTDSYLHVEKCVRDTIPRHDTDSQNNG